MGKFGQAVTQRSAHRLSASITGSRARPAADGKRTARGQMAMLARDGDEVIMENAADAASPFNGLLIAGVPMGETVARYGPFVMNTKEEIYQAFADYRSGRMGAIDF